MPLPQENFGYSSEREDGYDCEEVASATGCSCFRLFCFGWDSQGESDNYLLQDRGVPHHKDTWLVAKSKKLKEFSELVAGPEWKNFIRKIGKFFNPKKFNNKPVNQFQYTPESYGLNFAADHDQEEDGNLLHSFSSRFACHALISDQQRRSAAL